MLEWHRRRVEPVLRRIRQKLRRTGGLRLEYLAAVDPETLTAVHQIRGVVFLMVAARIGSVRLIDCLPVHRKKG